MSAWGAGQTKTERVVGVFFCTCEVEMQLRHKCDPGKKTFRVPRTRKSAMLSL